VPNSPEREWGNAHTCGQLLRMEAGVRGKIPAALESCAVVGVN
jgi:hypothetical protein